MTGGPAIRPERPGDEAAIHALVAAAFKPMPFSDGDEQDLVNRLRADGDLVLSLVAIDAGGLLVGHVGFSPVTIDERFCGWFQMAPVSVAPRFQRRGIGSQLIRMGLAELRQQGAGGAAVVGNPVYYERFGFTALPGLAPVSAGDAPYFRALAFSSLPPRGTLRYAPAFG